MDAAGAGGAARVPPGAPPLAPGEPEGAEPPPGDGAPVIYQARFDARLEEVSRVCEELHRLAAARVGEPAAGEIDLGLAEALSNIVRHGCAGQPGAVLELACVEGPGRWCLRIFDRGRPVPAELLSRDPSPVFDFDPDLLDALPEGGMGLALMRACFDDIDYRVGRHGNLMVLCKRFGPDGADAARPRPEEEIGAPAACPGE